MRSGGQAWRCLARMAVAAAESGSSSIGACSQPPAAASAAAAVQQLTRGLMSVSGASSHSSSWGSRIQQPWYNELHKMTDGTLEGGQRATASPSVSVPAVPGVCMYLACRLRTPLAAGSSPQYTHEHRYGLKHHDAPACKGGVSARATTNAAGPPAIVQHCTLSSRF